MVFVYEDTQFCRKRGSRREVLDGLCWCTSGGLVATDLEERDGKIISKKRSRQGKERFKSKNPFTPKEEPVDEKEEKVEKPLVRIKKTAKAVMKTAVSDTVLVPTKKRKRRRGRRGKRVVG